MNCGSNFDNVIHSFIQKLVLQLYLVVALFFQTTRRNILRTLEFLREPRSLKLFHFSSILKVMKFVLAASQSCVQLFREQHPLTEHQNGTQHYLFRPQRSSRPHPSQTQRDQILHIPNRFLSSLYGQERNCP